MKRLAAALLFWAGAAAAQDIVVIGDSVMAWNGRGAIPEVLAENLGREVENLSVPGARLSHPGLLERFAGLDIRRQIGRRRPDVLILTAGGNDLGDECGCGRCDGVLDGLIAPDARSGELAEFLTVQSQRGTRVIYLGYYDVPVGGGPFSGCERYFEALDARIAALAGRDPGIDFVSAREVIDPANPGHYDADRVHPSRTGSARIGGMLADRLRTLGLD